MNGPLSIILGKETSKQLFFYIRNAGTWLISIDVDEGILFFGFWPGLPLELLTIDIVAGSATVGFCRSFCHVAGENARWKISPLLILIIILYNILLFFDNRHFFRHSCRIFFLALTVDSFWVSMYSLNSGKLSLKSSNLFLVESFVVNGQRPAEIQFPVATLSLAKPYAWSNWLTQ